MKENNFQNQAPIANNTRVTSQLPQQWLFDTGASHHVTNDPSAFTNFSDYGGPDEIVIGNGSGLKITHIGTSEINSPVKSLMLDDVLYAPSLNQKLVSMAKLCSTNKVSVEFFPTHFQVRDLRTGVIMLKGQNQNDVYYALSSLSSATPQINITSVSNLDAWHNHLGHPATSHARA